MPRRGDDTAKAEYARFNRRIAARVKDARLENGYTQEELGNMIGRAKTWVSTIESARFGLTMMDIAKIGDALNRPLAYFLSDGLVTTPQFMVPSTEADWRALYPNDSERAEAHWKLDKLFTRSEQVIRAREKVLA